jgi:hypothetical protein
MVSYCRYCDTPIWREYRFNGIAPVAEYYDHAVLRCIEHRERFRITHCPGCGEWLNEKAVANNTGCSITE